MKQHIELPYIDTTKITDDLLKQVDALQQSLAADNVVETEQRIERECNISSRSQRRYKTELRKMFEIPSRTPLTELASHPQIRQAIEAILTRSERSDKSSLRSGKNLSVIVPKTGEVISLEEHLKACYPYENTSQSEVYETLLGLCKIKRIVDQDGNSVGRDLLPSEVSVARFLRAWKKEYVAVRRGKSRKDDWAKKQQTYITRNANQYRAGEVWIADHTELDFMVLGANGKPDRRWITTFIDMRTRLLVGYHLSWQPSSQTIALAFRNAVLGIQLKAAAQTNGEIEYRDVHIMTRPDTVMMDNGKDYRSKYTKGVFGKIDFDDNARRAARRITKLHYVKPYHGQSKAPMERWYGTIQTMMRHLPGYKGNAYQNKPDSLKEDLKSGNILTVEEFDRTVSWMINAYNNRVHSSLNEQSPMQYYLSNAEINQTIDIRVLDFLLMRVQRNNGKPPKIQRGQVVANGIEYFSESLVQYNNNFADVYYDPNDPGYVSVYVEGEFAAIAVNKLAATESDSWKKQLKQQTTSEKEMLEQLKSFRAPYSKHDVKQMILIGRLTNVAPVSEELLQKEIPTMTVLTGIEEKAKQHAEELQQQKQVVEIEQTMKKRAKNLKPLTPDVIANIQ